MSFWLLNAQGRSRSARFELNPAILAAWRLDNVGAFLGVSDQILAHFNSRMPQYYSS
jgi:hypothetical protein